MSVVYRYKVVVYSKYDTLATEIFSLDKILYILYTTDKKNTRHM